MGTTTSKEAVILDALSKHDVRKLRACFANSDHSPLHLLAPLSEQQIDVVHDPKQERDPNKPTPYQKWLGMSPAHIAAELPDIRVLREIVSLVASADETSLTLDDGEVLKFDDGNIWTVRDTQGLTPLSRAVRANNNEAVTLLLKSGASIDEAHCDALGDNGPTAWSHIRYCAANGIVGILRVLLENGCGNDSWGRDGRRAVHHAVEAGQLECVKILIEHDRRDCTGQIESDSDHDTSSHTKRIRAIAKYVVRECSIPYPPEKATEASIDVTSDSDAAPEPIDSTQEEQGQPDDITSALHMIFQDVLRGVPFGTSRSSTSFRSNRERGATLLHLACSHSHPHILQYLLSDEEFRLDLERMNDSGKAPIFMAIRHGSMECLKLLVEADANVHSRDIENWTALHEAVKAGDDRTAILQYLIDECNVDINAVDDDGWTALHVAARFSSTAAVDILVKAGCNIDALTEDNETAVLLASAQASSSEVLRRLLANGADLRFQEDRILTPFRLVVGRKDFDQLCILLDHIMTLGDDERLHIVSAETQSDSGDTLLHFCVAEGNLEATTKLLNLKTNPDEKNVQGHAPIHSACRSGKASIAAAILQANGDPNLVTSDGMTPLHIACASGHERVAEVLVRYKCDLNPLVAQSGRFHGFTPLMFAARLGHPGTVSQLVKAGADLNLKKGDGFTALHLAALNGNTEACQSLVAGGADHMVEEEAGYTPLQLATRHNKFEVVTTLLEAKIPPDSCGKLGLTSLHIASFICDARLVWLLIRGGADVNGVNVDNATPLHVAAGREQGRVSMQLLLANGAKLDVIDSEEDTPLHNACYKGLHQNVRLLLRRGAAPSPTNENNITPLHLAAAAGSEETVEALLKYGADVEARDNNEKTPYNVASEQNHRQTMVLLFRSMKISLQEIAPTKKFQQSMPNSSSDEILCVICQNPFIGGEETRTLPCSHTYHNHCILAWLGGEDLTRHDSCPLCQKSVLRESTSPQVSLT